MLIVVVCVEVSEELLEVVAEGGSKLFGGIMDVVTRIQEVLAVRPSDSGLQPRLAPTHDITGVHHHTDKVGKRNFMVIEKGHQGRFQILSSAL